MGNYLKMASQQHISALLDLGWSQRRIAREVGVHRETVGRYAVMRQANPANPIAGSAAETRPNPIPGPPSAAAPYHDAIRTGLERGLTAQRIWQDLRDEHGYAHGYLTVQRYARGMKRRRPEVADVMEHPPGEEAQVDYFKSPAPVLNAATGRWVGPGCFA